MILNDSERSAVTHALDVLGEKLTNPSQRPTIYGPYSAVDYLRLLIGARECEQSVVLYLDAHHKLVEVKELATGEVDSTNMPPRPIIQAALANCARFIVLAHNHPSGDCTPSDNDLSATRTLVDACALFGIDVLDHFVIGRAPGFPAWSIGLEKVV